MKIKPITQDEYHNAIVNCGLQAAINVVENKDIYSSFKVGDACVYWSTRGGIQMMTDTVPQKYVVVLIDQYGLIFAKRMLPSGGLSRELTCLNATSAKEGSFVADPSAVEAALTGHDSYDPELEHKQLRNAQNRVRRNNAKIRLFNKDTEETEIHKYMREIKPGTVIWKSDALGTDICEYEVISHVEKTISKGWGYNARDVKEPQLQVKFISGRHDYQGGHVRDYDLKHWFYRERPISIKDKT